MVEKPAMTMIGSIFCSITAISSSDSPTAASAFSDRLESVFPLKKEYLVVSSADS